MKTAYKIAEYYSKLQQAAAVDPETAELVNAYVRLRAKAGRPIEFYDEQATVEAQRPSFLHDDWLSTNASLDSRVKQFLMRYGNELMHARLPVIYTVEHLAFKLGVSEAKLKWLAYAKDRFSRHTTFKKSGGLRQIHVPVPDLAAVQRWVLQRILSKRKPHKYATAFYPGSGVVQNSRPHINRQIVIRLDFKDFFPSITFKRLRKVFESFGYTYSVSSLLANLCSVDGQLPQGAPTSPALSNLVAYNLDKRMEGLKKKLGFRYSRYADDLVFSSNYEQFPSILPFLREVIREEGFEVNEEKTKVMRHSKRQAVTGIVVNERLSVPREYFRELRAVLFNVSRNGVEFEFNRWRKQYPDIEDIEQFKACLRGRVSYVASIDQTKGLRLLRSFQKAFQKA